MNCTAHILETSPRAAIWLRVFGCHSVPILSPVPFWAESLDGPVELYRLDVQKLTVEQRERLIAFFAERFVMNPADVAHLIDDPNHGVPLFAADLAVPIDMRYVV